VFNTAVIAEGGHGRDILEGFLMGTDQHLETECPVPKDGVGKGELLPGECVSDTRQTKPLFLAEQHHPVVRMENKGPEAGDDKNCADQEKDRYEGFPIHLGRVMIMNTTVSGLGGKKIILLNYRKYSL
jgi:hypothetical protein